MSKLTWDDIGKRFYETGVDQGVLYPMDEGGSYPKGVAWNGLTAVNEAPTGGEPTALYADNTKYLNLMSVEEFGFSIEAYTYPDEFAECDGTASPVAGVYLGQQTRKQFGFCYRTKIGNDVDGDAHGYKLHIAYGCQASPSDKGYTTVNDSPDAATLTWDVTTTAVPVTGYKNVASLVIDSRTVDPLKLAELEKKLYGDEMGEPMLPLPDEIITILNAEE